MSVSVMEDYKLRDLRVSHTLGCKDAAPHVRLCGKFTAQPHVRCTCGKRACAICVHWFGR
jgi:hypothetical protein